MKTIKNKTAKIEIIVQDLEWSIRHRFGLKEIWKAIPPKYKTEIMSEWKLIIQAYLEAGPQSPSKPASGNSTGGRKTCGPRHASAAPAPIRQEWPLHRPPAFQLGSRDTRIAHDAEHKAAGHAFQSKRRDVASRGIQGRAPRQSPSKVRRLFSRRRVIYYD